MPIIEREPIPAKVNPRAPRPEQPIPHHVEASLEAGTARPPARTRCDDNPQVGDDRGR